MLEDNKACAYVSLKNIRENYEFAKKAANGKEVLAVVKANAYGHGAVNVANMLYAECGCRRFAVANLDEAVSLRKSGLSGMILILGYTSPSAFKYLAEYDISQAVASLEYLKLISDFSKQNGKIKIHIKLETGMNRTGFDAAEKCLIRSAAEILSDSPNLIREGIFTHFATAEEEDTSFTKNQLEKYKFALSIFNDCGIDFQIHHVCNSAAIFLHSDAHFDMVRFGIGLYGYGVNEKALAPAMEFSASVVALHEVKSGKGIGYNLTYKAKSDMLIATICAGYADGFRRELSNKGHVYINGRLCPIVGRICMDMAMIDVSELNDNIKIGDRAEIFGSHISCEKQAKLCGTISYELLCGIGGRVPRIYSEK